MQCQGNQGFEFEPVRDTDTRKQDPGETSPTNPVTQQLQCQHRQPDKNLGINLVHKCPSFNGVGIQLDSSSIQLQTCNCVGDVFDTISGLVPTNPPV